MYKEEFEDKDPEAVKHFLEEIESADRAAMQELKEFLETRQPELKFNETAKFDLQVLSVVADIDNESSAAKAKLESSHDPAETPSTETHASKSFGKSERITIRIPSYILRTIRDEGKRRQTGYQSLINEILCAHAKFE